MNEPCNRFILTDRFTSAVDYVRQVHTEFRKGTCIPYMAHLFGVAAIVMGEAGGMVRVTEDMVIGALLHDTVEDHGGMSRLKDIEARFGDEVARMVAGLSDTFAEDHDKKEGWEDRKNAYINRLRDEPDDVMLISIADKIYNAKSILDDYREIGPVVWDRFKRGRDQQLWYFDQLLSVFKTRNLGRIVGEFERIVLELKAISAAEKS